MKYMLLIYYDERELEKAGKAEEARLIQGCHELRDEIGPAGKVLAADRLHPTATATSVRTQDGKVMVTDGPFAETREQLAGYWLIEAKDLDEAISVAARIPPGRLGTVEIRPVMELETAAAQA